MNSKTDSAKAHGCCSGGDKTSTANEAVDTKTQTRQVSSDAGEIQLNIQGASCASCVTKIEIALKQVAGVTSAEMNFAQRTVLINSNASPSELVRAVEEAGYNAHDLWFGNRGNERQHDHGANCMVDYWAHDIRCHGVLWSSFLCGCMEFV
mgnify:CR=1 FL=1